VLAYSRCPTISASEQPFGSDDVSAARVRKATLDSICLNGGSFFDGPSAGPPLIAIHGEHGKSRSATTALALLADHLGAGRERDAVNVLLRCDVENSMHPNPLVISLADDCLFRYGRINTALAELCPQYTKWRELWRNIAADRHAYWGTVWRVLRNAAAEAKRPPQHGARKLVDVDLMACSPLNGYGWRGSSSRASSGH
jgi:hypothetical protein